MRDTDEVAKCMWFLADTGWTVTDDDLHVKFQDPGEYMAVVADEGFNPYIYWDGKPHYAEDLFTAVVVAFVASNDPAILDRVKWTNNDNPVHGPVSGECVIMKEPHEVVAEYSLAVSAWQIVEELNEVASETALIVRLDVRETSGGHVWTIYWQEASDGEA